MPTPEQITAALRGWPDTISAWRVLCEAHTDGEARLEVQKEDNRNLADQVNRMAKERDDGGTGAAEPEQGKGGEGER